MTRLNRISTYIPRLVGFVPGPLQMSKLVSGPTIFRFSFISVPVFNQKVFDFLVKISHLWSHVTVPGPLAGVKFSFRTYHISVQFHFGSSVQPKSVRFFGQDFPTVVSCHQSVACHFVALPASTSLILSTFVEGLHWRGGLIVEHVPQKSSHHNY